MSTLALMVLTLVQVACSSADKLDASTAEGAYQMGQRLEADERFEEAITYYDEVRSKHPYSRYATEAELRIADIHYARESFIEAESAYRLFREYHPSHEKLDYVIYRLAMSYFMQLPPTIDRDLQLADRAIQYFDEVLRKYPNSEWSRLARENRDKTFDMLAEKELYIARFYLKREDYDSALGRFEGVLATYGGKGRDAEALYGAAISAKNLRQIDKYRNYAQRLQTDFPKSPQAKELPSFDQENR